MRTNRTGDIAGPEVTLRIPGTWERAEDFFENLPHDCRCTKKGILIDGVEFELNVLPADDEFPGIFANSCPKLPTESERDRIENYRVNVCVSGLGGSLKSAARLMSAAAAVMAAGGAGVFIDNSGIAHGASDWLKLLEGADDGGVYWAFVAAVRSEEEVYSLGMHVLGLRDAVIPSTGDAEFDSRTLHSFLGYTAFSGATLRDGEVVGDMVLPTFIAHSIDDDRTPPDAPMHNPYGRWRLKRFDIESN